MDKEITTPSVSISIPENTHTSLYKELDNEIAVKADRYGGGYEQPPGASPINSLTAAVTCDRQAACTHVRVMYTLGIGPAAAIRGRQVIFTMGRL